MRGIKTLLAVAVIAGAGAAHASTIATFNVSETGLSAFSTQSLTGTGVLDSSGSLTINLAGTFNAGVYGIADITTTNQFFGTIAGNVFTPTSGQSETKTCDNNATLCTAIASSLNVFAALTSFSGSVNTATGGVLVGAISASGQSLTSTDTLTPVAPTVPVPAAAWLFGSGLLGLTGAARRRS